MGNDGTVPASRIRLGVVPAGVFGALRLHAWVREAWFQPMFAVMRAIG